MNATPLTPVKSNCSSEGDGKYYTRTSSSTSNNENPSLTSSSSSSSAAAPCKSLLIFSTPSPRRHCPSLQSGNEKKPKHAKAKYNNFRGCNSPPPLMSKLKMHQHNEQKQHESSPRSCTTMLQNAPELPVLPDDDDDTTTTTIVTCNHGKNHTEEQQQRKRRQVYVPTLAKRRLRQKGVHITNINVTPTQLCFDAEV